jgi:predicted negative regulator of RcsB-dependent stress response
MSNTYKEQKKAMKQPDEFQKKGILFLDWLFKNTNKVVYVAIPVILVFAASSGYKYYQEERRNDRLEELGKVQVIFEAEQRAAFNQRQDISKQIDELEKKINPPAPTGGEAAKPVTPDPKLVAEKAVLEKKMDDIQADHQQSTGKFLEFFKKYENTPEGWMAGMTAARLMAEQKKVADARPVLETVIAKSKDNRFYQTQSRLSLIGILEELGDYDAALTQVDALEKSVDADLKPKILLAKGRLQMLKNSKDDAKATFNALIESHGSSPEAQKARSIQSLLN